MFKAVPVVGGAAGAFADTAERLVPKHVSQDLKCTRALLQRLKVVEKKIDAMHSDIRRLGKVLDAQVERFSKFSKSQGVLCPVYATFVRMHFICTSAMFTNTITPPVQSLLTSPIG